jgi:hypothetical protein
MADAIILEDAVWNAILAGCNVSDKEYVVCGSIYNTSCTC